MARRKCPVCGLFVGKRPHTGPIHDRIFAARRRLSLFAGRRRKRRRRRG